MAGNATEKQLGELHGRIARVMDNALKHIERAQEDFNGDQSDELYPELNPALLSVVAKFLDQNKITCAVEESQALTDMQRRLEAKKAKRQSRTVGNVSYLDTGTA